MAAASACRASRTLVVLLVLLGSSRQARAEAPAWLGVVPQGVPGGGGAWITDVVIDGPADIAGVQLDDVIQAIDGVPLGSGDDLVRIIGAHGIGDRVTLRVWRGTSTRDVVAVLAPRLTGAEAIDRQWARRRFPAMPMLAGQQAASRLPARGAQVVVWFSPACQHCGPLLAAIDEYVRGLGNVPLRFLDFETDASAYAAQWGLRAPVFRVVSREFRGAGLLTTVLRDGAVAMTIDATGVVQQTVLLAPGDDDGDAAAGQRPACIDEARVALEQLLRPRAGSRSGRKATWQ